MLFLILIYLFIFFGNHRTTPPNCLTTPQGVATPTLGTTTLTDSARSGGGAYSGRMTEQSLTVQRSCRLERGSTPESVAIRDWSKWTVVLKLSFRSLLITFKYI